MQLRRPRCSWERLQRSVLSNHGWQIRRELGSEAEICPLSPDDSVKQRFLEATADMEHNLSIGYHGTSMQNVALISQQGLRVPRPGGMLVANGSAHGVGIYTAKLGSASLSKAFARGTSKLFVCAICDTSEPLVLPEVEKFIPSSTYVMTRFPKVHSGMRQLKGRQVVQESDQVRHVGDAMVVFEERCVVPLFTVDFAPQAKAQPAGDLETRLRWSPPQHVGRRRVAIPEEGHSGIVFAEPGVAQKGRTVWLAPEPDENATPREKAVQRRLYAKRRCILQQKARLEKQHCSHLHESCLWS